jgi:glycosyltransferase involved in cell wall biosynthesis
MATDKIVMQPKIQVFLLTYNRPEYVKDAISSILNQDYDDFELIVSDNSTDSKTEELLKDIKHPKFKYLKRTPSLPSIEHFFKCIHEVTSEYFVLFHDDDMMMTDYLSKVITALENNPSIAAAGTNCYFIYGNKQSKDVSFPEKNSKEELFDDIDKFVSNYLLFKPLAAYPSYMYRASFIKGIFLNINHGGKHSDVTFLMDILKRGKILWLMEPLIKYRIHSGQDSQKNEIHDRLSLLRYIYIQTSITRHSPEAMNYRRVAWCNWLKYSFQKNLKKHPKRYVKVFKYMLPYLIRNKWNQISKFFNLNKIN